MFKDKTLEREIRELHKNLVWVLSNYYKGEDDLDKQIEFLKVDFKIEPEIINRDWLIYTKKIHYNRPYNRPKNKPAPILIAEPAQKKSKRVPSLNLDVIAKPKILIDVASLSTAHKSTKDTTKDQIKEALATKDTLNQMSTTRKILTRRKQMSIEFEKQLERPLHVPIEQIRQLNNLNTSTLNSSRTTFNTSISNFSSPRNLEFFTNLEPKTARFHNKSNSSIPKLNFNLRLKPLYPDLALTTESKVVAQPAILTERSDYYRTFFVTEPKPARNTQPLDTQLSTQFPMRSGKDWVATHAKGLEEEENVDVRRHVMLHLLVNQFKLRNKNEKPKASFSIITPKKEESVIVDYVPIKIKQFVIDTNQKEFLLLSEITKLYEHTTGKHLIKDDDTIPLEYTPDNVETMLQRENYYIQTILNKIDTVGLETIPVEEMNAFKTIIKKRAIVLNELKEEIFSANTTTNKTSDKSIYQNSEPRTPRMEPRSPNSPQIDSKFSFNGSQTPQEPSSPRMVDKSDKESPRMSQFNNYKPPTLPLLTNTYNPSEPVSTIMNTQDSQPASQDLHSLAGHMASQPTTIVLTRGESQTLQHAQSDEYSLPETQIIDTPIKVESRSSLSQVDKRLQARSSTHHQTVQPSQFQAQSPMSRFSMPQQTLSTRGNGLGGFKGITHSQPGSHILDNEAQSNMPSLVDIQSMTNLTLHKNEPTIYGSAAKGNKIPQQIHTKIHEKAPKGILKQNSSQSIQPSSKLITPAIDSSSASFRVPARSQARSLTQKAQINPESPRTSLQHSLSQRIQLAKLDNKPKADSPSLISSSAQFNPKTHSQFQVSSQASIPVAAIPIPLSLHKDMLRDNDPGTPRSRGRLTPELKQVLKETNLIHHEPGHSRFARETEKPAEHHGQNPVLNAILNSVTTVQKLNKGESLFSLSAEQKLKLELEIMNSFNMAISKRPFKDLPTNITHQSITTKDNTFSEVPTGLDTQDNTVLRDTLSKDNTIISSKDNTILEAKEPPHPDYILKDSPESSRFIPLDNEITANVLMPPSYDVIKAKTKLKAQSYRLPQAKRADKYQQEIQGKDFKARQSNPMNIEDNFMDNDTSGSPSRQSERYMDGLSRVTEKTEEHDQTTLRHGRRNSTHKRNPNIGVSSSTHGHSISGFGKVKEGHSREEAAKDDSLREYVKNLKEQEETSLANRKSYFAKKAEEAELSRAELKDMLASATESPKSVNNTGKASKSGKKRINLKSYSPPSGAGSPRESHEIELQPSEVKQDIPEPETHKTDTSKDVTKVESEEIRPDSKTASKAESKASESKLELSKEESSKRDQTQSIEIAPVEESKPTPTKVGTPKIEDEPVEKVVLKLPEEKPDEKNHEKRTEELNNSDSRPETSQNDNTPKKKKKKGKFKTEPSKVESSGTEHPSDNSKNTEGSLNESQLSDKPFTPEKGPHGKRSLKLRKSAFSEQESPRGSVIGNVSKGSKSPPKKTYYRGSEYGISPKTKKRDSRLNTPQKGNLKKSPGTNTDTSETLEDIQSENGDAKSKETIEDSVVMPSTSSIGNENISPLKFTKNFEISPVRLHSIEENNSEVGSPMVRKDHEEIRKSSPKIKLKRGDSLKQLIKRNTLKQSMEEDSSEHSSTFKREGSQKRLKTKPLEIQSSKKMGDSPEKIDSKGNASFTETPTVVDGRTRWKGMRKPTVVSKKMIEFEKKSTQMEILDLGLDKGHEHIFTVLNQAKLEDSYKADLFICKKIAFM